MKKRSEETQTLRAGCIKAEPTIFAPPQTPLPGARDGQNLISWRWLLLLPTNSGAGTIRHEGARAPPLLEIARHGGTEAASLETSHASRKHFLIKSGVWQGCFWWCQIHPTRLNVEFLGLALAEIILASCELRWASRDWTACWYCTATRTEPKN